MFGYVVTHKPELKVKDLETYQAYYCGLCEALKKKYGFWGRFTLNYDMTMAVLFLSGLYEPETKEKHFRCPVHPLGRHVAKMNCFSDYAADMNILLAYEKALDDVRDEGKLSARLLALMLKRKAERAAAYWPRQAKAFRLCLGDLYDAEQRGESDLDTVSGCFGHLMEELFVMSSDLWEKELRRFGFYLGKFIYILDCYVDLESDRKNGSYNPLFPMAEAEDFEKKIEEILEMMMAEAAYAFEFLPIVENADILRNIIYAGVWTKFRTGMKEEKKANE